MLNRKFNIMKYCVVLIITFYAPLCNAEIIGDPNSTCPVDVSAPYSLYQSETEATAALNTLRASNAGTYCDSYRKVSKDYYMYWSYAWRNCNSDPVGSMKFVWPKVCHCARVIDSGEVGIDSDGDGVENYADNCPNTTNPGQEDFDFNDIGDACDVQPEYLVAPDAACPPTDIPQPFYIFSSQEEAESAWLEKRNWCNAIERQYSTHTGYHYDDKYYNYIHLRMNSCGENIGTLYFAWPKCACSKSAVIKPDESNVDTDGDSIADYTDNCPTTPNLGQEDYDFNDIGDVSSVRLRTK